ncbi:MAG: hypothetical protein COV36_04130 [Alphaproteobacteria bacterium CG11_big_fil_rev_8_21_14_0_20_44_7]|nr:MAG: hypothetical protein COV36_04130 [Alphaproteobacteria bacterium CG11_big_fil_rev_8_21_14_0_20_44_7]
MEVLDKELKKAVAITRTLLEKLINKGVWADDDDHKLEKLTKIVSLMNKMAVADTPEKRPKKISRSEDKRIIKEYLDKNK